MIASNILRIKQEIGQNVQLVVVSKFRTTAEIQEAYDAGQRVFAENRVQALLERYEALPKDIVWHLIGHLQTNKVKYIAEFIHLIQGVDSLRLLKEVNRQGARSNKVINVLLQMHIAKEETKYGMDDDELREIVNHVHESSLPNVNIMGLMGMASFTNDLSLVRRELQQLHSTFEDIKKQVGSVEILSM